MKEHKMYEPAKLSNERLLNDKLATTSFGWVDDQRTLVLEAMEEYANLKIAEYKEKLKAAIDDDKEYKNNYHNRRVFRLIDEV